MNKPRYVLDNNVLISALLLAGSTPALALEHCEAHGIVLYSTATLAELSRVLTRPKFSRYLTPEQIDGLLARIHRAWEIVTITHQIRACRDPKDDMLLELVVGGQAQILITGDKDLLALAPYRGIAIVPPSAMIRP